MPPSSTSTFSSRTSFLDLASATLSVVALSSRCRLSGLPNNPPLELISSITIFAMFALATPRSESGPVISVITPTLMDAVLDEFIGNFSSRFLLLSLQKPTTRIRPNCKATPRRGQDQARQGDQDNGSG